MSVPYPGVERLQIADPRMSTELVHRRLRELIYSGALPGGTVLSQLQLAKALGVSRTPLREAFRMLQEEGLVEGEPNRRCRVAMFDSADLDAIYGTRLVLEAVGMRLTLPGMDAAALAEARSALARMEADPEPGVGATWHEAHLRFHGTFTSGAPEPFASQIAATAGRATRYITLMAAGHPLGSPLSAQDHRTILALVVDGRYEEAVAHTALHFARTALMLLAGVDSEFEPVTIRSALGLITGSDRGAPADQPRRTGQRRTS